MKAFVSGGLLMAYASFLTISATGPASASTASIRNPDVLAPAGRWNVDYGLNKCTLTRVFGDRAHSTTFQLSKIDPNPNSAPAFAIASAKLLTSKHVKKIAIAGTGNSGPAYLSGSVLSVGIGAPPILYGNPAGPLADLFQSDIASARATQLTIAVGDISIALALGKMAPPLHALNQCMDNLARTWGYDPDVQRALKAQAAPITPTDRWFNAEDYPEASSAVAKSGGVTARLDISVTGAVIGCHVMEAGGDPAFEQLTCAVAKRNGRFKPALDENGKPVAAYFPLRVIWRGF